MATPESSTSILPVNEISPALASLIALASPDAKTPVPEAPL